MRRGRWRHRGPPASSSGAMSPACQHQAGAGALAVDQAGDAEVGERDTAAGGVDHHVGRLRRGGPRPAVRVRQRRPRVPDRDRVRHRQQVAGRVWRSSGTPGSSSIAISRCRHRRRRRGRGRCRVLQSHGGGRFGSESFAQQGVAGAERHALERDGGAPPAGNRRRATPRQWRRCRWSIRAVVPERVARPGAAPPRALRPNPTCRPPCRRARYHSTAGRGSRPVSVSR